MVFRLLLIVGLLVQMVRQLLDERLLLLLEIQRLLHLLLMAVL